MSNLDQKADVFSGKALEILQSRFGFTDFRLGQLDILKSICHDQKDTLAVMPTGGGKSLCFQLPALYRDGLVVIISPLIALMRDQVQALQNMGIEAGARFSGQTVNEKKSVFQRLQRSKNFLLYVSPERTQTAGFLRWFRSQKVSLIAIDEAHCVSQWGHDFRPDYAKLSQLREAQPEVPILALTATATPQVISDITRQLHLQNPDRHTFGFYRPNLYYQVETCLDEAEKESYTQSALQKFNEGRALVYCGTRKKAEELSHYFEGLNFERVGYYHAGLSAQERAQVEADYAEGEIRILFATNAFGMGIDHPDVRLVIHFQIPANVESYYQEIGRAGRDGKDSTCLMLYSTKDKGLQSYFIQSSKAEDQIKSRRWRALNILLAYIDGGDCRHSEILTYFKDAQKIDRCGHCDSCEPASDRKVARPHRRRRLLKKMPKKAKPLVELPRDLTEVEKTRVERLTNWRFRYAKENQIPAFLVASNKSLRDLAIKNPNSLIALEEVHGFAEKKVEQLGTQILEVLRSG